MSLNLGRFTSKVNYQLFMLTYEGISIVGHELDVSASYAYSPLARTTLLLDANTIAARATAQLTTSIRFGTLSTLILSLRETSGSSINATVQDWWDTPSFSAILSLAIGVSPF